MEIDKILETWLETKPDKFTGVSPAKVLDKAFVAAKKSSFSIARKLEKFSLGDFHHALARLGFTVAGSPGEYVLTLPERPTGVWIAPPTIHEMAGMPHEASGEPPEGMQPEDHRTRTRVRPRRTKTPGRRK